MPALDGLRALAVSAVFAYHAGLPWAMGGFLGVDVFFVISGYLITALLVSDWRRLGRIDIRAFWYRRARRLLPALLVLLAAMAVVAPLLAMDQMGRLRTDLKAALTYVSNWRLIFEHQSYFEATGRPPLLQHLWSLAVEEQFYLLWPPVLALALRFKKRPARLVPWILGGAAASALLMAALYDPVGDPSRVYFGTDTRLSAILIGAALACVWRPGERPNGVKPQGRLVLEVAGGAALVGLWMCVSNLNEFDTGLYRGGFAGVAVLSAVLVAVAARPGASWVARGLAAPPLVWLGRRSYGVYLWYWPVLMLTRPDLDVPVHGTVLLVLRAAITLALAAASYRWVEVPVRNGALGRLVADLRSTVHFRARKPFAIRPPRLVYARTAVIAAVALAALAGGSTLGRPGPAGPALASPASEPVSKIEAAGPETQVPVETTTTAPPTTSTTSTTAPAAETTTVPVIPSTTAVPAPAAPVAPATLPPAGQAAGTRLVAVGDSVMASARNGLLGHFPESTVDAAIGRQFPDVVAVVRRWHDAGQLSERMVVHVGNNGPVRAGQFDELMGLLLEVDRVVVINDRVPRPWERVNNEMFQEATSRWPNMALTDWNGLSSGAGSGIFQGDGTHLRPRGVALYVGMISAAL